MSWRAAAGAVVVGLLGAVATATAWGYFAGQGTGAGPASVAQLDPLQVGAAAGSVPALPGAAGDLALSVRNPNPVGLTVTGVDVDGPVTVSGPSGCTAAGLDATATGADGLDVAVAAGATVTVDLPGALSLGPSADPGCQGATVSVPVDVTARS